MIHSGRVDFTIMYMGTTEWCYNSRVANLYGREDDSCVGMGETRSHPLTDTLGLLVILGLVHTTDRQRGRERKLYRWDQN